MAKSPVSDRMAAVENRYGKTLGASKGSKPAPPAKIKPTGSVKNPGIKITKKF